MSKTQSESRHLLRNAIQCPDGTILESKSTGMISKVMCKRMDVNTLLMED